MDYRSGRHEQEYNGVRRAPSGQHTAHTAGSYGYGQRSQHNSQQEIAMAREMAIKKRRDEIERLRVEKQRRTKRRRRIIAMIVAECFALTVIFGYAYFARRISLMPRPDVDKNNVKNDDLQVEDIEKMKGYWMIAIFGVDSRSGSVGAGYQSDVNIICCINQDTGEIKLVSVFRDTYLNINDEGRYSKFNEAYARGGPEQALKFLNKNLDLNITDYVTFSWKAVAEGINILGGVDLEISKAEYRYINAFITETVNATGIGSYQLKNSGMNHLDGVQAVAYGRLRLMDTDYARTERQRKIIELAFAKAKQADLSTLNNILVTVLPQVTHNLDMADLTEAAFNLTKYHIGETAGFPFARDSAIMGAKGDCVIPLTLESNVSELHTFLFGDDGYTPTETVKQISAKISSDSGMYKQGKSVGHVSTEGYLPSETTKAQETTAKETTEEDDEDDEEETDGDGNPIESSQSRPTVAPSIGETDEFGNLVDGPEPEDPDEWGNNPLLPGDYYPSNPSDFNNSGNTPGSQRPGTEATFPSYGPSSPQAPSQSGHGPGYRDPGTTETAPMGPGTTLPGNSNGVVPSPGSNGTTGSSGGANSSWPGSTGSSGAGSTGPGNSGTGSAGPGGSGSGSSGTSQPTGPGSGQVTGPGV